MGLRFTPGITLPLALVMAAMAPVWMPDEKKADEIAQESV